jgi:epoxide hydrolase 4
MSETCQTPDRPPLTSSGMEFTAQQIAGAVERLPDGLQIEHCFAEVHGERLHYVRAGKGDPIVFLHGFPQFWYSWRHQLAEFAADHLVIAADLRGYNLSSKPNRPQRYAMSLLVEDLRALIEHLDLAPFTLVGHDWGGLVAWAFAIIYPEQLHRLVITTASHPTLLDHAIRDDPEQQEASQFTFLLTERGIEEALAADDFALLASNTLGFDFLTENDRAAYRRAWSQEDALRAMVDYYRVSGYLPPRHGGAGFGDYAPEFRDKTIEVPTLVIYAEGSPYARPATLKGLGDFVPNLRLERVPSETHWLHEEQPELVNRLLRAFLDENVRQVTQ